MLFYRAVLPLSHATLVYVADVIRRHRRQIGSCWRKLNPGQQALLALADLRNGGTFAELAAGFGISTATTWQYVTEAVRLLAAHAPSLRTAVRAARKAHAFVVIDGTLIPVNRLAADRPFYSGKHLRQGMNLQVIASPGGEMLWVSSPLPGSVHDLTAARIWGIVRELAAAGLIVLGGREKEKKEPKAARQLSVYGQGLRRSWRSGDHALQGTEQARLAEGRQPGPRPAPRSGRTGQPPAET